MSSSKADSNVFENKESLQKSIKDELYFEGNATKNENQQGERAIKKKIGENDGLSDDSLSAEENSRIMSTTRVVEKANEKRGMSIFCINCGEKNNIKAKFCQNCGKSLKTTNMQKQTETMNNEEYQQSTYFERKQEFAGKITKCPNCGEILGAFISICPSCGYELRNTNVANSVENFSVKIEQATSDEQKVTLIRNFPISNTKEDIFEFMILASSNIAGEYNEVVFNAWLAKFNQCYQKATLTFGNDPDFVKIQNIYNKTAKQINKEKTIHSINKVSMAISRITAIFPNPIFGLVFILFLIWELKEIISGDFILGEIIVVVPILWCVYKITNKKGKNKEE